MRGACPRAPARIRRVASSVAPSVASSTREERLAYVRERYQCLANCDQCGLCRLFHRKDPEHALRDYIDGRKELAEAMMAYR